MKQMKCDLARVNRTVSNVKRKNFAYKRRITRLEKKCNTLEEKIGPRERVYERIQHIGLSDTE
jgi:hypothetical protein